MKKSELNSNIHLSEGNIKSKGTDDIMFLTWSLPSVKCCPYSTEMCRKRCFAKKNETFKNVRYSRYRNLEESKKDTFVKDMIDHLSYQLQRPKAKDKLIIVRIHTSGDFYSKDYFEKWVSISDYFKNNDKIMFQAYTKSMPIIMDYMKWYENEYDVRYGKEDYEFFIQTINIHLVWSIWEDTDEEYTELADWMELQTFIALPKNEIDEEVNKGAFLCEGDCGLCKECYTGDSKKIVIPYH